MPAMKASAGMECYTRTVNYTVRVGLMITEGACLSGNGFGQVDGLHGDE